MVPPPLGEGGIMGCSYPVPSGLSAQGPSAQGLSAQGPSAQRLSAQKDRVPSGLSAQETERPGD